MADFVEIEPRIDLKVDEYPSYKVDGPLYTIPYVVSKSICQTRELTFTKSKEKFIQEFRCLPKQYSTSFDEKSCTPTVLETPIDIVNSTMRVYMHESSSQHMSTILSSIEDTTVRFESAEILVASETLYKISDAVFNPERCWRLRAFVERVQGRKMILLCDDDITDEVPQEHFRSEQFRKERIQASIFAQKICEQAKNVNTNAALHGCLTVLSTLRLGSESLPMVVFGEVDMTVQQQPSNTFVLTGITRTNQAMLGKPSEALDTCFKYLWSRSYWLGLQSCLFGLRHSDEEAVTVTQRVDLTHFFKNHRHRIDGASEDAFSCVARVLFELRSVVETDSSSNWIVEYKGLTEGENLIKIEKAEESWSFWLAREKFHMMKEEMIAKKLEKAKEMEIQRRKKKMMSEDMQFREFPQKKGVKLGKKKGTLATQFGNYLKKKKIKKEILEW